MNIFFIGWHGLEISNTRLWIYYRKYIYLQYFAVIQFWDVLRQNGSSISAAYTQKCECTASFLSEFIPFQFICEPPLIHCHCPHGLALISFFKTFGLNSFCLLFGGCLFPCVIFSPVDVHPPLHSHSNFLHSFPYT